MKLKVMAQIHRIKKSVTCFRKDRGSFGLSYKIWLEKNRKDCRRLEKYKNIHCGERCFIVGTGPSLRKEDLVKIANEKIFGVNTLYKMYDDMDWRATYYCIIDPNTYGAVGKEVTKYHEESLFIAGNRIKETNANINKFALNCSSFYRLDYKDYYGATDFGEDLSDEIFDGASVIYAALQIAVYMGFKEIYLLGVDCNYELKRENLHNENLSYADDYKYNWTKQTGLTMIECFKVAKDYADKHGIAIYNATRGGMLEVFPRVNIDDLV